MIKTERDYQVAKAKVARFKRSLQQLQGRPTNSIHPTVKKSQEAALQSQLAEVEAELKDYEAREKPSEESET
jgi:hypothetical protein